ncbi:hypothetical protein HDE_04120 [Halotydeus destructor]|nr:hypothetical protein HDE_04120 [Halotydeus destructor]
MGSLGEVTRATTGVCRLDAYEADNRLGEVGIPVMGGGFCFDFSPRLLDKLRLLFELDSWQFELGSEPRLLDKCIGQLFSEDRNDDVYKQDEES